jgi:protein-export membrane protein SecD
MRALSLVWICGWVVACRGTAERGRPEADKAGVLAQAGSRLQIVYDLDLDQALEDRAASIRRDLEAGLADRKLSATVGVSAMPPGELTVTPGDGASKAAIEQLLRTDYGDTIEGRACEAAAGPSAICIRIAVGFATAIKKAALAGAASTVRARLVAARVADPTVVARGDQIVVEFPAADPQGLAIRSLIARAGKLEFKVVDEGSGFMKRVFVQVGSEGRAGKPTDPRAIEDEIAAEVDQWRAEDGGPYTDYFLIAHDREQSLPIERARRLGCPTSKVDDVRVRCNVSGRRVIESYLAELAAKDPTTFKVPEDRQIGYERHEPLPDAQDRRPSWRTYYLERAAALTGTAISNASGTLDPNTNRPLVLLEFTRDGARKFGELTSRIVGKKLATLLDDAIKSAPIINGPIRGGRASITMGGGDLEAQEAERDELITVLKTGSLPAPLREVSSTLVP